MSEEITKVTTNKIISSGLRSIAASVPGFASIGQAWSEYENYRTTQRIKELIDNISVEVENMKNHVDNVEEVFTNIAKEFPSLLEITVEKVRKEFSEEKRKIYAHVLVGLAIASEVQTYDERTALLHELETLTPLNLNSLTLFRSKEISKVNDLNWQTLELAGDINEQLEQLASSFAKLESRGLIMVTSVPTPGIVTLFTDGLEKWAGKWRETEYRILPLGKQLLSVLD